MQITALGSFTLSQTLTNERRKNRWVYFQPCLIRATEGRSHYFHLWGSPSLPLRHGHSWAVCDTLPLSSRFIFWPQQIPAELVALRSTNLLFIYSSVNQTLSVGLSGLNTKVFAGRAVFLSFPCSLWHWQDSVRGGGGLRSPVSLMAVSSPLSSSGPFSPPASLYPASQNQPRSLRHPATSQLLLLAFFHF